MQPSFLRTEVSPRINWYSLPISEGWKTKLDLQASVLDGRMEFSSTGHLASAPKITAHQIIHCTTATSYHKLNNSQRFQDK